MGKFPVIHVKNGKRYFVVHGRKIFLNSKMTKKELVAIHKLLSKKIRKKEKKKSIKLVNKASAVIKQYINTEPKRKQKQKSKPFKSTINPLNRVSISGSDRHPKDSGDKDLINSLINKLHKPLLVDYSDSGRLLKLKQDPDFQHLTQDPNASEQDYAVIFYKYGLSNQFQDYLNKKHSYNVEEPQDEQSRDIDDEKPRDSGDEQSVENLDEKSDLRSRKSQKRSNLSSRRSQRRQFNPSDFFSGPTVDFSDITSDAKDPDIYPYTTPPTDEELFNKPESKNEPFNQPESKNEPFNQPESKNEPFNQNKQEQFYQPNYELQFNPDTIKFSILKSITRTLVKNNPSLKDLVTIIRPATKDQLTYRERFKNEVDENVTNEELNQAYKDVTKKKEEQEETEAKKRRKDEIRERNRERRSQRLKKFVQKVQSAGQEQNGGLFNDEIEKIMSKFHDFKGCIMRDEIKKLLPHIKPQSRLAFIINTDPHNKSGQHWDAIYIDARKGPESSNSLEWFDSFGRSIPPDILEDCKLILHCLKPETVLKVKENRVVHQSDNTSNCGWFCVRFLIDRFRGKSFSEATGYDEKIKINHINKDEKEIEKFKNMPQFNYISV